MFTVNLVEHTQQYKEALEQLLRGMEGTAPLNPSCPRHGRDIASAAGVNAAHRELSKLTTNFFNADDSIPDEHPVRPIMEGQISLSSDRTVPIIPCPESLISHLDLLPLLQIMELL